MGVWSFIFTWVFPEEGKRQNPLCDFVAGEFIPFQADRKPVLARSDANQSPEWSEGGWGKSLRFNRLLYFYHRLQVSSGYHFQLEEGLPERRNRP